MAESAQSTESETGTHDINTSVQSVSANSNASGQVPTVRTTFELGRVYDIDCGTPNAAPVAKGPVLSSSRSNSEDEDEQTPNGDDEATDNTGRPKSPPPNCAICLGRCKNKCFTDSCMHQFCFKCLCEWSKVKPECPLCKQSFEKIIHNVKSDDQFEEYHIQQQIPMPIPNRTFQLSYRNFSHIFPEAYPIQNWENSQLLSRHGRTYFYRAVRSNRSEPAAPMYDDSGSRIVNDRFYQRELYSLYQQENPPNTPIDMHRLRIIWRRLIYEKNIYALPVSDITGSFRESNARYYRDNPAQVRRIITFIGREVRAILRGSQDSDIRSVKILIRQNLPLINILSPAFRRLVTPHIGEKAPHFIHEVYNFARSPFDMIGYDEVVQYTEVSSEEIVETTTSTDNGNATNSSSMRRGRRQVPMGIRVNVPPTTGLNMLGDYDSLTRTSGQSNNSSVINLDISTMSDGSEVSGISPGNHISAVNLTTRTGISEPVIIDSDDTDDESYINSSTSSGSSNVEEVPNPSFALNPQRSAANTNTDSAPNSNSIVEATSRQDSDQNPENHTNDGISEMVLQLLLEDLQPNNAEQDRVSTSEQPSQSQNDSSPGTSSLPLITTNSDSVSTANVNRSDNPVVENQSNQPDLDSGGGNVSSNSLVMQRMLTPPIFDDLNDLPDVSNILHNIIHYTDSENAVSGPSTSQTVSSLQNSNSNLPSNVTASAQTPAPSASSAPSVSSAPLDVTDNTDDRIHEPDSQRGQPSLANNNVPAVDLTTTSAVIVRIHPAFQSTADTLAMQMHQASRPTPVITANIVLNSSSSDDCEFVLARRPPHLRTPEQMVSLSSTSDSDCIFVTETKQNLKNVPFATSDEENENESNKTVAVTGAIQRNLNVDPASDDDNVPSTSRGLRSRNKKKAAATDNVENTKTTKRRRSTRRRILSKRLMSNDFSNFTDSTDSESNLEHDTLKNKPKRSKVSFRKNQRNSSESSKKFRNAIASKRKKTDTKAVEENKKIHIKLSKSIHCDDKSSSSNSEPTTDDEDGLSLHNLQKRLKDQKVSETQPNLEDKPNSPEQNLEESSGNEETESSNDNMRLNIQDDEPGKSSIFTLVSGGKRNDEKATTSFFDLRNMKHRFKVDKATDAQNDLERSDTEFDPNGRTIPKSALRLIANLPFTDILNSDELPYNAETNTTKLSTQLFKASPSSLPLEESGNSRESTELQTCSKQANFDQDDSCSNMSENSQDSKKSHSEHSKHSQCTKDCPGSPSNDIPSENSQDSEISQNSSESHLTKSTNASHNTDESSRSSINTNRTNISNESNHSKKSRHSSFSNNESQGATKSNYSSESSMDSESGNDDNEELVPDLTEHKTITVDIEKTNCSINDYDIPGCSNSQLKYVTDTGFLNAITTDETKKTDLGATNLDPDNNSDSSDASCYIKPRRRKHGVGDVNINNTEENSAVVAAALDKDDEHQRIKDSVAERLRNETRPIRIQPRKCPRDRYPFGSVVIERRCVKRKSSSKRHRSESSRSRSEGPAEESKGPCSGTACRIVNNQHIPLIDPVTNDDSNSSTTKTLSYVTLMQAELAEADQRAAAEQARKREAAAKIYGIRNISEDSNDTFFFES